MRVLFVDPGKMTGWGILYHKDPELFESYTSPVFMGGEMSHDDFLDYWGTPSFWMSPDTRFTSSNPSKRTVSFLRERGINRVVVEAFDILGETLTKTKQSEPLWSIEQIGCLRTWCRWSGVPFELQSRTAKAFDTDGAKLRKLGWWEPAEGVKGEAGHRRDAARHALKWGVDHGLILGEQIL